MKFSIVILSMMLLLGDSFYTPESTLPLDRINLPDGFKIEIYAEVPNARTMTMGDDGTLYVGARRGKVIHAVKDTNGDYKADEVVEIGGDLDMANGVAWRDGDLYVAEVNRILKYKNIATTLNSNPNYEVVYDKYPTDRHHGWKYIAFGPDGKLYVPVGAPCNICDPENEVYASITRMNPDGTGMEVFASGVRNSVGFTWHPDNKEMWFTDNGRDLMGDDLPPCEVNHAPEAGMHFGYPYCHAGDILDPEFGSDKNCDDYTAPAQRMGAHVAPLGLKFYTGKMFPSKYTNQLIVAEHGSWNRSKKSGYKLSLLTIKNNKVTKYETLADGWLDNEKQEAFGRPVDLLQLKDGSLLVSDDFAGVIYRISYSN